MEDFIKKFISYLFPKRHGDQIEGTHPDLKTFVAWYNGETRWHFEDTIVSGEKKKVKISHSGFAKIVGEDWASSFMNENLKITIPNEKQNEVLREILQSNGFFSKINGFTEKYFILGVGATVVMPEFVFFDKETKKVLPNAYNRLKISFLDATRFIPITIDDGVCTECAIIRYSTNKCTLQLHLLDEKSEYIIAETYGKKDNFFLKPENIKVLETHSKLPYFQIFHPSINDNKYLQNQLGTSVIANSIDWLKAFDITFDRFHKEFKNGAKKRFISSDLVYIDENGDTKTLALSEEDVYIPKEGMSANLISEYASNLRSDSFIRGLGFFANMVGRSAGLGDGYYEVDQQTGRPLQTATAEILKNKKLHNNIRKNENLARDRIKKMVMAIKEIYNKHIESNFFTFDLKDIVVDFDDNIIEDTDSRKKQELLEVQNGVLSLAEYRSHWYGEDIKSATDFLQKNGMLVNSFISALQTGALPPEMFVDIVYGPNVNDREKIIQYIQEHIYSSGFGLNDNDYADEVDIETKNK